jgi:hypothetical protein
MGAKRNLYYKSGYLLDFPRTINDLAKHEDAEYQAEVFATLLGREPYFLSYDPVNQPPLATIVYWTEFEAWLETQRGDAVSSGQGPTASRPAAAIPTHPTVPVAAVVPPVVIDSSKD